MARSEEQYLRDILASTTLLRAYVRDRTRADLAKDQFFQDAVVHRLEIIGEAAAHLSMDLRSRYASIEWTDIVVRNVAIHGYFSLDLDIVWATATVDAPLLGRLVQEILDREFPPAGQDGS